MEVKEAERNVLLATQEWLRLVEEQGLLPKRETLNELLQIIMKSASRAAEILGQTKDD